MGSMGVLWGLRIQSKCTVDIDLSLNLKFGHFKTRHIDLRRLTSCELEAMKCRLFSDLEIISLQ